MVKTIYCICRHDKITQMNILYCTHSQLISQGLPNYTVARAHCSTFNFPFHAVTCISDKANWCSTHPFPI